MVRSLHDSLPTASTTSPLGYEPLVAGTAPIGDATAHRSPTGELENQLVQVRLGIASSLFTALRMKHADTALHSLRVGLNAAAWMTSLGMSDEQRDVMEVAALLHDVGKIGVPDSILLKPNALTKDEVRIMDQHRQLGVEILRSSCSSPAILEIVAGYAAWFDGSNPRATLKGEAIPLGARMLSICDAFDAMVSDQVYRRAMPREKALVELYRFSGTQFDPELVKLFLQLQEQSSEDLFSQAARRWLRALAPEQANSLWRLNTSPARNSLLIPEDKFRQRLLDNMRDGVVFVDASLRILSWNSGAERMTGLAGSSVHQRQFTPDLIAMRTDDGFDVPGDDCPVLGAVRSGEMRNRRVVIRSRGDRDLSVEIQVIPVAENDGTIYGAVALLHDVSSELSLEARCQSLHEAATKDPLTQVANRAEFNRVHEMFVMAHLERRLPCSLIIADIDHFKQVNDNYGHQAGDDVLQSFAALLRSSCRPGDLVARYGGEEFVLLCADCSNAVAAQRAEGIRKAFSLMPHPALGGHFVTSSFGVTEIQAGDTPETMLKRSDRALYEAKEGGRNRVVQLGMGLAGTQGEGALNQDPTSKKLLIEQQLFSLVPLSVVVEKLKGFVSDHQAKIVTAKEDYIRMQFAGSGGIFRRRADRKTPLSIELNFEKPSSEESGGNRNVTSGTHIHVRVLLQRRRDRRRADALDRARQLLASLRSYLMASELDSPLDESDDGLRQAR